MGLCLKYTLFTVSFLILVSIKFTKTVSNSCSFNHVKTLRQSKIAKRKSLVLLLIGCQVQCRHKVYLNYLPVTVKCDLENMSIQEKRNVINFQRKLLKPLFVLGFRVAAIK